MYSRRHKCTRYTIQWRQSLCEAVVEGSAACALALLCGFLKGCQQKMYYLTASRAFSYLGATARVVQVGS